MGLGPMEVSGIMSRVQDFAIIKQNEDMKGHIDQTNYASQFQREVNDRANTVKSTQETSNEQKKFDAKEKGSNEYYGDGGKKRNDKDFAKRDGKVVIKGASGGFDIRI